MSGYDSERHHRRSIRLKGFDYTRGWFFVTICTASRSPLFGHIVDDTMRLSTFGMCCQANWEAVPEHFSTVSLDASVVMPNHIHAILALESALSPDPSAAAETFQAPVRGSLATVIRSFKSATTKAINDARVGRGGPVWQRGYFERVIRDERELERFRRYIENNPARWSEDEENPGRGLR